MYEEEISKNPCYNSGWLVGEILFLKYLPTLSVDIAQTRNVVPVPYLYEKKYKLLENDWFQYTRHGEMPDEKLADEAFKVWRAFAKELEDKFLPKEIVCNIPDAVAYNKELFLKGVNDYLWNTDLSYYKVYKKSLSTSSYNPEIIYSLTLTYEKE
jgi:hypothetical protein